MYSWGCLFQNAILLIDLQINLIIKYQIKNDKERMAFSLCVDLIVHILLVLFAMGPKNLDKSLFKSNIYLQEVYL